MLFPGKLDAIATWCMQVHLRIYTCVTYVASVTDLVPRKELPDREHWEVGDKLGAPHTAKHL